MSLSSLAQEGGRSLEERLADPKSAVERLVLELELVKERKMEGDSTYAEPLPRIIREARGFEEWEIQSKALVSYGLYHELHAEADSALVFYRQAERVAIDHDLTEQLGDVQFHIGNMYRFQGEHSRASAHFDTALTYFEKAGSAAGSARALFGQGVVMDYLGDVEGSTGRFYSALEKATEAGDSLKMANCNNSLGIMFLRTAQYDKAEEHYLQALSLMKRLKSMVDVGNITDNIGILYRIRGDYPEAIRLGQEALEIRRTINDKRGTARGLMNLSLAHMMSGELAASMEEIDESIAILQEIGDRHSLTTAMNRKASVHKSMGQTLLAEQTAKEALELSQELGSRHEEQALFRNLSDIYEQAGRYDDALDYYKRYHGLKDSILNEDHKRNLNELETKYRTAEKDKRIAIQQNEIITQQSDLDRLRLWVISLSALAVVILLVSWAQYRSVRQKRDLEQAKREQLEAEKKVSYAQAVLSGQEAERGRIAKDLHDGLGAILATAKLHLAQVQEGIEQLEKLKLSEKAGELLDNAYSEVRRISHDMMPASLERFGLEKALESLCDQIRESGMDCAFESDLGAERLDADLEVNLYRIVQEAVNNMLKYAEAQRFDLRLLRSEASLDLYIEDDGKGFDMDRLEKQGLGLENMRSRAGFFEGVVEVDSAAGRGTRINVRIPLDHG